MKIKLAVLATLTAVNCYADTTIGIPKGDLNGFTVIKAEINSNGTVKSAVQDCSSNENYCNIVFPRCHSQILELVKLTFMQQIATKK